MNTVTLNKKSWHYWIASEGSDVSVNADSMCEYVWLVFKGIIRLSIFALVLLVVLGSYLDLFWTIWLAIQAHLHQTKMPEVDTAAQVAIGFTGVAIFLFGVILYTEIAEYLEYRRPAEDPTPTSDSFVLNAWRTIREKTCVKVQFK
jgi:hypothetical protein